MLRSLLSLLLVIVFSASLTAPAKAINVTVGLVTYDVVDLAQGAAFTDNQATIEASPWWGDQALADAVSLAFANLPSTPMDSISRRFAFSLTATVNNYAVNNGSRTGPFSNAPGSGGTTVAFTTGTIVSVVPEINASAMGQGLFVLLAFGFVLTARRARRTA